MERGSVLAVDLKKTVQEMKTHSRRGEAERIRDVPAGVGEGTGADSSAAGTRRGSPEVSSH